MSDNNIHLPPIDPVLQEILPEFIEYWYTDLTTNGLAFAAAENVEELYRYGHTIKGSFLQFGFRDLAVAGRHIMAAAEARDWADAVRHITALHDAVSILKRQLIPGDQPS